MGVPEASHGAVEVLSEAPPPAVTRPLTTEEKLARTTVDAKDTSGPESSKNSQERDAEKGANVVYDDAGTPRPATGLLATLCRYEAMMDRKLGIESAAVARVLPEEKTKQPWHSQAVMALMWASGTMNLSCFATGFLGFDFGLDLKQSMLCVVFATFVGSAVTGWCATLGPGTGLRQVAISRYSFGWWPSKIIAALNVVEQLGWSAVGSITGGLALSAVTDGHINLVLGVIIVTVVGVIFSFVGLRGVLGYEKYAWMVFFGMLNSPCPLEELTNG